MIDARRRHDERENQQDANAVGRGKSHRTGSSKRCGHCSSHRRPGGPRPSRIDARPVAGGERDRYDARMQATFDVLIVGGGLVGSSLAIALDGAGWRVALAEAQAPRANPHASPDERNLALASASVNALRGLGVWGLAAPAAPIRRIHVSRRGDFGSVRLEAAKLDLPDFGAVLPARELGNALLQRLDACADLVRLAPATVVALEPGDASNRVVLRTESGEQALDARLVVAADGTESFVRAALGIGVHREDYRQSILVTTV